jgi:pSer/pThr/pTyr-binding forkhead associated (FHA) protein
VLAGSLAIGRDSSPDWLRDRYQREGFDNLSRSHALIKVSGEQAQVTDLHSSNGTFLNGKALTPQVATSFRSGDELRFASRLTITVRQRSQA